MKGPNSREPRSFTRRRHFIHIMNSVDDYAIWAKWAKFEKEDIDALSEWVKSDIVFVCKAYYII